MNKRGFISEEAIIRIFELAMVLFVFSVLLYNVRAEIKNKAIDQSYGAIDLALEGSLVSSAPGKLEVSYLEDKDFRYLVGDREIILLYGTSEKGYRFLLHNDIEIEEREGNLILRKNEQKG